MTLELQLADARAQIESLTVRAGEADALRASLTEAEARIAALTQDASAALELAGKAETDHAAAAAELETLRAVQRDLDAEVERRAAALVAGMAHQPVAVPVARSAESRDALLDEYKRLPAGAERAAFRNRHAWLFNS